MSIQKELQAAQAETKKLSVLLDRLHTNLKGISSAIKRDDQNRCWVAGHGTHVFLIEDSLQQIETYIEGSTENHPLAEQGGDSSSTDKLDDQ